MREKLEIMTVFWIFNLEGNASNVLEWKVDLLWILVCFNSRKCNKLSNLFNCLVLSHHEI